MTPLAFELVSYKSRTGHMSIKKTKRMNTRVFLSCVATLWKTESDTVVLQQRWWQWYHLESPRGKKLNNRICSWEKEEALAQQRQQYKLKLHFAVQYRKKCNYFVFQLIHQRAEDVLQKITSHSVAHTHMHNSNSVIKIKKDTVLQVDLLREVHFTGDGGEN